MTFKIEVVKKTSLQPSIEPLEIIDISFDFDDEDSEVDETIYPVETLFRMIGSGKYSTYYVLKEYERLSKQISLFDLENEFKEKNSHLCANDCFLQFMFFIVMADVKDLTEDYLKKRKIAQLFLRKLEQLGRTDESFKKKIEYIRLSPIHDQNYANYAEHWDLKYVKEEYCRDDDIQSLLFNCTKVYTVSEDFVYENMLKN